MIAPRRSLAYRHILPMLVTAYAALYKQYLQMDTPVRHLQLREGAWQAL